MIIHRTFGLSLEMTRSDIMMSIAKNDEWTARALAPIVQIGEHVYEAMLQVLHIRHNAPTLIVKLLMLLIGTSRLYWSREL